MKIGNLNRLIAIDLDVRTRDRFDRVLTIQAVPNNETCPTYSESSQLRPYRF